MAKRMNPHRRTVLGSAITLGTNMAAGMALFTFLGYKVDQWRGDGRMATLLGMFLGLFYGGYEVWKLVRQMQTLAKDEDTRDTDGDA